jgi:hypothetical protein
VHDTDERGGDHRLNVSEASGGEEFTHRPVADGRSRTRSGHAEPGRVVQHTAAVLGTVLD